MKIEKVNDNQIRCTLTREDLEDRHIKISELAYGSAKAKSLFKDMVEQANYEFGFETNDIPLMVEAIPLLFLLLPPTLHYDSKTVLHAAYCASGYPDF